VNTLSLVNDRDLERMLSRAWYESVRCWDEARQERDPECRRALLNGAAEAEAFWAVLQAEQVKRLRMPDEDTSDADYVSTDTWIGVPERDA